MHIYIIYQWQPLLIVLPGLVYPSHGRREAPARRLGKRRHRTWCLLVNPVSLHFFLNRTSPRSESDFNIRDQSMRCMPEIGLQIFFFRDPTSETSNLGK